MFLELLFQENLHSSKSDVRRLDPDSGCAVKQKFFYNKTHQCNTVKNVFFNFGAPKKLAAWAIYKVGPACSQHELKQETNTSGLQEKGKRQSSLYPFGFKRDIHFLTNGFRRPLTRRLLPLQPQLVESRGTPSTASVA